VELIVATITPQTELGPSLSPSLVNGLRRLIGHAPLSEPVTRTGLESVRGVPAPSGQDLTTS
jgi:hypothetical protein